MSVFNCALCEHSIDSDYFPCHLVKIHHRKVYVNDDLICDDCLMELVEAIRDGDGEDFAIWDSRSEYVSALKMINEDKF